MQTNLNSSQNVHCTKADQKLIVWWNQIKMQEATENGDPCAMLKIQFYPDMKSDLSSQCKNFSTTSFGTEFLDLLPQDSIVW